MPQIAKKNDTKCDVQMTAMIDVVFQLLIFFMCSFKIIAQEGDFNVKMPALSEGTVVNDDALPSLKVRLTHQADGSLSEVFLNGERIDGVAKLREIVLATYRQRPAMLTAAEVEFDCDYDLKYEHVIAAVTAVSGYTENGRLVKLVEKIKFAPPLIPGDG